MPKFNVTVTRRLEQTTDIVVEAPDEDGAYEKVSAMCSEAENGDLAAFSRANWEIESDTYEAGEVDDA